MQLVQYLHNNQESNFKYSLMFFKCKVFFKKNFKKLEEQVITNQRQMLYGF